jgi:endonuclease/exonuclease/phosphatase family metal-dependent hydrolase
VNFPSALLAGVLLATFTSSCQRSGASAPQPAAPLTLRVLTYNIHHGEGRDRRFDLLRLAEVMRSVQPDLIALQEVDRGTQRAGGVDQLTELAGLLGMHAEFGKTIDHTGGEYGVAILSRWPIAGAENRLLPSTPEYEPRTALTVRVRVDERGPWVRFTSTHLDNSRDPEEKLAQARRLNELLVDASGEPSILAGDFNARPGTDAIGILEENWTIALPDGDQPSPAVPMDGPSNPARGSQQRRGPRGDFILLRPADPWRVLESRSIDDQAASDHRPVLTVLEWTGKR